MTESLTTNESGGRYECHIDRRLLGKAGLVFAGKPFTLGRFSWLLRLDHASEGTLSAFLVLLGGISNRQTIEVHTAFEVVNADPRKSICRGFTTAFVLNEPWGGPLTDTSALTNPRGGFLFEGKFVVAVEVRASLPDNEWQSMSGSSDKQRTITWKLKNVNLTSPWMLQSCSYEVGGLQWQIQLHPRGLSLGGDHVSLHVLSPTVADFDWNVKLTVENYASPKRNISIAGLRKVEGLGVVCGSACLIHASALEDETLGFLKEGYLTIKADFAHSLEKSGKFLEQSQNEEHRLQYPSSLRQNTIISIVDGKETVFCACCRRPIIAPKAGDAVCTCLPVPRSA